MAGVGGQEQVMGMNKNRIKGRVNEARANSPSPGHGVG
jgi:hypothetical protein